MELGSPIRTLASEYGAYCPAWFPDGRKIAYVKIRGGAQRLVRSPVTGASAGVTFLTSSRRGEDDWQPDVSPDGKRIAFCTHIQGVWQIAAIDADGSNFTLYCPGMTPRWSPDGQRLVFDREVGLYRQIFVIDLAKAGQVSQLTTDTGVYRDPAWSPDGLWVVFEKGLTGSDLCIMKNDGSNVTQLTSGAAYDVDPSWSSDGFIYFASKTDSDYNIWRLKPILPE